MKRRTFKVFKEEGACVSYLGVVFSELFQNYNNSITYLIYKILRAEVEKAMAPYSSTLAWKIPWTEGPCGLQSMGSLGVGHN